MYFYLYYSKTASILVDEISLLVDNENINLFPSIQIKHIHKILCFNDGAVSFSVVH